MKLLAIDTSSLACTVAISGSGNVVERYEERAREHTRILMPMIREVLQEAGCTLQQLDAIVLGNGPGSFIGMRIAASVAQGLAFGAALQIVPVSSMAAVAAEVFATTEALEVAVAQDAHMNEVYLGVYGRGDDDLPVGIGDERLQSQSPIHELSAETARDRIAAGAGWQRYPDLFALNTSRFAVRSNLQHPRARYLLAIAAMENSISPQDVKPAYLRQKVAEKPSAA